jgi:hypothetical protein
VNQRRVLIISPHFPPVNAADHQRVRMSLPYLHQFGWDAHVLAVKPEQTLCVHDPLLAKTVPKSIPITYTSALPIQQTQKIGVGSLGLRSLPYLLKAGSCLLQQQNFDLIYFSTTVFPSMALGALWNTRFGVPYVLDFQDPWLSDYYKQPGAPPPPGGKVKYGFSQLQARMLEPITVRSAAHITTVSPAYPQILQQRYPEVGSERFTVLPFGAPEKDFELLPTLQVKQTIFDPNDGKRHWVYVGRGGHDMAPALKILFQGLWELRSEAPEKVRCLRLHFVGTSYAPKDRAVKTIEPLAKEYQLQDLVEESTQRVPYFEALQLLVDSDAIMLIGSNDPGYTASKLYPCVLARKPIGAIFHHQSSVVNIMDQCEVGPVVSFKSATPLASTIATTKTALCRLISLPKDHAPNINWDAFKEYTAREMTRKLCEIFDRCLESGSTVA